MIALEPLLVRKSRSNFNYLFNAAFSFVLFFYGYALLDGWPSVSGPNPAGDELLAGVLLLAGVVSLATLTVVPWFDRAPLLRVDAAGVAPRETGNLPVPYHELGNSRFEKIQEGRSSYWYFLFSQSDAATGLEFQYKISADEFDCDNSLVEYCIQLFSQAERKGAIAAASRPAAITTGLTGDALVVSYAADKEIRSIALYWLIAAGLLAFATYAAILMNFGARSLGMFVANPHAILSIKETWYWAVLAGVTGIAAVATIFRLRDIFFRPLALHADRYGLASSHLGEGKVAWSDIAAIRFEPDATLHVTVTGGSALGERFIPIARFALSQQELFQALAWLLARLKIKLRRMDE